jgi:hypothetical protein
MIPCKKLPEVPPVATEWQLKTWCPDCEFYDLGTCRNATRTGDSAPCPFDGEALPLREVAVDPKNDQTDKLSVATLGTEQSPPLPAALEQAVKHQIVRRTAGRIQMLEVEVIDNRVVVRGRASCYYLKQLALRGVFDVLGAGAAMGVELKVEVMGSSPSTR